MTPEVADFEAALKGAREPLERLAVYADELAASGDPQGELLQLHLRADKAETLAELELTTQLHRSFGLATRELQALSFEWRLGFIDTLTVKTTHDHLAPALSRVLAAPACRFLRRLRLQTSADAAWFADVTGLEALARLNTLTCTSDLSRFREVSTRLPHLTHLAIGVGGLRQRDLSLPRLRSLDLRAHQTAPPLTRLFARPPWTLLEHLALAGLDLPLASVLAANPLKTLHVYGGPAPLESLVSTDAIRKVEKLTLRGFHELTPLVANRERLRNLRLHIERGTCPPEQLGVLRATLKEVTWAEVFEPQRSGEAFQRKLR